MFKFITINVFLILFVISSARKKQEKLLSGVIEKLTGKTPDEYFDGVQVQKQLFQDIISERQVDDKLQFGYVCENPLQWEQRFEEKDIMEGRHRGKVKWGNADGTYGEQYWDINHR